MADSIVKLTRELIGEFTKDRRTVKFFEQMQGFVVDAIPVSLAALFLRVDQASAIADDALAMSQQAIAKAEKQDQLIDVPVNFVSSELPLNDVRVPQVFENQLLDVPIPQRFDLDLPEILIQTTDTRKFDAITSSYGSRWISSASTTVNTTEVDLTATMGGGTLTELNKTPFRYDSGVNAFFMSLEYVDAFFFDIVLRVSGTAPSPASQSQPITFFLRRVDGTLITTADYVLGRGLSATFTNQTVPIPTFVFAGGADPYQVQGFRISAMAANAGWTLTDKTLFLKR